MTWNEPGLTSTVSLGVIFTPALDEANVSDAVVHRHLVNFECRRNIHGAADQPIGGRPVVGDFHVAGGNACPFRGGARPRIDNIDRACLVVTGLRSHKRKTDEAGDEECSGSHGAQSRFGCTRAS